MTIVFVIYYKKINSNIIMTYISIIYAIITTIIITVYFIYNITLNYYKVKEDVKKNNKYNKISFSQLIYNFLLLILNSIIIILLWLFLFMHIKYQIFYINILYLILAILLGTNLILYLIYHNYFNGVNYNKRGYYINPKIVYGIVTEVILHEDDKRPIISFEYIVNNVKYTNTSDQYNLIYTNYKKNDRIKIIYSSEINPAYSSIYDETITYYSWIYIILLVIALILLWIFFIYDIYNISL